MVRAIVLAAVAVLLIFPLYIMVTGSVQPYKMLLTMPPRLIPAGVTVENYGLLLEKADIRWIGNTLIVVCGTALLSVAISSMAGYGFSVYTFRGRGVLMALLLAFIIIPEQVLVIPQYLVVRWLRLTNTLTGAILPRSLSVMGVFLFSNYIRHIPRELVEAGRIDGAGEWRIMLRLVFPMCKPVIGVVLLLYGIQAFGDFLWQMLVLQRKGLRTLLVGLMIEARNIAISHNDIGVMLAVGTIIFIPLLLVYISTARLFHQGLTLEGLR